MIAHETRKRVGADALIGPSADRNNLRPLNKQIPARPFRIHLWIPSVVGLALASMSLIVNLATMALLVSLALVSTPPS